MNGEIAKKIIVALDGISEKEALKISQKLKGLVWGFKINDLLFENPLIIKKLKRFGKVFADAKLYDIPNTVGNSVKKLSNLGANFITVHASGGIEMMKSAKKNAGKSKIIAVTVLTSKTLDNTKEVLKLARNALKAGVDGVVVSGHELESIKKIKGMELKLKVVPGIRPNWFNTKDDQKRKMTPMKAVEQGADYLVVGRPITKSKDPIKALERLCGE